MSAMNFIRTTYKARTIYTLGINNVYNQLKAVCPHKGNNVGKDSIILESNLELNYNWQMVCFQSKLNQDHVCVFWAFQHEIS